MNTPRAALQTVVGLSLSAFSEVVGSSVNFTEGLSLRDALTDAILELDSEADELRSPEILIAVEEPVVIGVLPARYSSGKIQRVRTLRTLLLGDALTPGAIAEAEAIIRQGL